MDRGAQQADCVLSGVGNGVSRLHARISAERVSPQERVYTLTCLGRKAVRVGGARHGRDDGPLRLRSGDEIYIGLARVVFRLATDVGALSRDVSAVVTIQRQARRRAARRTLQAAAATEQRHVAREHAELARALQHLNRDVAERAEQARASDPPFPLPLALPPEIQCRRASARGGGH